LSGSVWIAALSGLLFALHPMHAESVAYVSGRTDLLAAAFLLGAFLFLLRGRAGRPRQALWLGLGAACYLLAVFAKETALMWLPFAALWLAAGSRLPPRRTRLTLLAVLSVLTVCYLTLRSFVLRAPVHLTPGVEPLQFPVLMLNTLGLNLRLLLVPLLHQPYYPMTSDLLRLSPYTVVALVFLATIPLLWRRLRPAALGTAWLLLFLGPVLNLLFLSGPAAAERFLYLPSVGLILTFAALADRFRPRDMTAGFIATATCLVVALLLGAGTLSAIGTWRSDLTLARAMVRATPDFAMAHNSLGVAYKNRGEYGLARQAFETALRLKPDYAEPHNNLGSLHEAEKDLTAAIAGYRRATELDSSYLVARNNLGAALGASGQPDSALAWFRSVLRISPTNAEAHNNLGVTFYSQGRIDSAEARFRQALALNPGYVRAMVNLSRLLLRTGDRVRASELARRAARTAPDDPAVRSLLQTFAGLR
jgi:Flp pilus assembly protein TadD